MKMKFFYGFLGLSLLVGGTYAVYSYNDDKVEAVSTQEVQKVDHNELHKLVKTEVPKVSPAELDEAKKNFVKTQANVKGDDIFYYSMITMTLQKLEFKGEKNYNIPNTPPSIERIQLDRANIQYLKNKAVESKASEPYQKILDKWLKGDFSDIQNDFLSIRKTKGSEASLETKVRTSDEEQKYIQHFFGDEGLQINKRDWQ